MKDTLKSFGHIVRATPEILRNGKPTILNEDGWRFAVEAMCAMDDTRHDFDLGPWQCGYDDGLHEGLYDFSAFMCHCDECRKSYDAGWMEGMKEAGDVVVQPEQKKKNEGPSEEARIFELMCMSEEVGTEFWRKTVPTYCLVDEKFEFVAKAIVAFADEQVEG